MINCKSILSTTAIGGQSPNIHCVGSKAIHPPNLLTRKLMICFQTQFARSGKNSGGTTITNDDWHSPIQRTDKIGRRGCPNRPNRCRQFGCWAQRSACKGARGSFADKPNRITRTASVQTSVNIDRSAVLIKHRAYLLFNKIRYSSIL